MNKEEARRIVKEIIRKVDELNDEFKD